ncbi:DNA polymerase III subunit gamma and tau, partial [Streptomyces sp. NPDC001251]
RRSATWLWWSCGLPFPEAPAPSAGAWPTAAPASTPAPAAPEPAPAAQAAAPAPGGQGNAMQVRTMWPDILEAVKNKRRFTWILLSQNAQVAGFDGTTVQLGFINAGARDNFASSGSEDVLRSVLSERFGVQWKVEAIIDPSGGTQPPPAAGNFGGAAPRPPAPPVQQPQQSQQHQQHQQSPQHQPSQPQQHQPPQASSGAARSASAAPAASAPVPQSQQPPRASAPARQEEPPPPPVRLEDDVPEDDDPDLVDNALSGHDLIVRELGATVVEEYTNEG